MAEGVVAVPVHFRSELYILDLFTTRLADSRAVLEHARTGTPMPDYYQAWLDIRILIDAIGRYAAAHDDSMPPNLGVVFPFIRGELLPRDTPSERARVFLSPRDERLLQVLIDPTPDWGQEHGSYVYLGAGCKYSELKKRNLVLVHTRMDDQYPKASYGELGVVGSAYESRPGVPMIRAAFPQDAADQIARSIKRIETLRTPP